MKRYSIFERGVHWIILFFILLRSAFIYYFVYSNFSIVPVVNIAAYIFVENVSLIFLFIAYLLLYLLNFKTNRNVTIIHAFLIILLMFKVWIAADVFTFFRILSGIFLGINIALREKINFFQEDEGILDEIDFNH